MSQKKFTFKKTIKSPSQTLPAQSQPQDKPLDDDSKYHYIPQQAPPQAPPPPPPQSLRPPDANAVKRTIQMRTLNPAPPASRPIPQTAQPQAPPPPQPQIQPEHNSHIQPSPLTFSGEESWHSSNPVSVEAPRDSFPPVASRVMDEFSTKAKTLYAEKTNIVQGRQVLDFDSESFKEQLQNYLELCDSISSPRWTFQQIIDTLYVLIESLNLDTITVAFINFADGKTLVPLVSRGYRLSPSDTIRAIWEKAIGDGPSVSWNSLMTIAANSSSELSKWVAKESLASIGYVPIHDNKTIYGFMFLGSHEKKVQSPIASALLELCGSRLGIILALRRLQGEWPLAD